MKITSKERNWAAAMLLVLLTVAAYLPVLRNGFIWDDDAHVTSNQTLRTLLGLVNIWLKPESLPQYYPLTHTSFWIEYHLWGLNPFGYHLVNVLLQALNALLLWRVLDRLRLPGAWLAAAIFAVHPVQVETVAWITERKNLLSATFYLLALWAYGRFCPWESEPAAGANRRGFYWLAFGCLSVRCCARRLPVRCRWWCFCCCGGRETGSSGSTDCGLCRLLRLGLDWG